MSQQTQLDRIEDKLDNFLGRLVAVETNQANARTIVAWVAGIIATLVAGVITAVASAFGGK